MRLRSSALFAATVVAVALVAAALPAAARVSHAAKAGTTTYVGTVKGVGSLAVVVNKSAAFGYLCDSADVSEWFKGTNKSGKLDLQSPSGATLAAVVTPKALDGLLVQSDGTASDFKLKKATGDAGLYRAEKVIDGVGYAAGWVVLPNGKVDGQVTAANLPKATVVLPTPAAAAAGATVTTLAPIATTATTLAPAATAPPTTLPLPQAVGSQAPVEVVKAFPTTPPPGDQVTVVPFTSNQNTSEGSGGGGTQATEPGGGPTTTVPVPVACIDPGKLEQQIAALTASLGDAPLLKRKAIKEQIGRLQTQLDEAKAHPGLNCTLPLK